MRVSRETGGLRIKYVPRETQAVCCCPRSRWHQDHWPTIIPPHSRKGLIVVRVLSVANQNRAVGKTTTTINLAACLARAGCRTLVIDLDPRCGATLGLGHCPATKGPLVRLERSRECVAATEVPGLELVAGSRLLEPGEAADACDDSPSEARREQLRRVVEDYEYVLVDCPSSLGQLTQIALAASSQVLIPIPCEHFAMEGLPPLIETIRSVMHRFPGQLEFGGVVLTMYDHSIKFAPEVEQQIRDFFGGIVFETVIPRDGAAIEAMGQGRSVMDYAPRSRAARAYIELCMEVLGRE